MKKVTLFLVSIFLISGSVNSQQLCQDFGTNGFVYGPFSNDIDYIDMALSPNGHIVILGIMVVDGGRKHLLATLDADGSVDKTLIRRGFNVSNKKEDAFALNFVPNVTSSGLDGVQIGSSNGVIYHAFTSSTPTNPGNLNSEKLLSFTTTGNVNDFALLEKQIFAVATDVTGFRIAAFDFQGELNEAFGDNGILKVTTNSPVKILPDAPVTSTNTNLIITEDGKLMAAVVTQNDNSGFIDNLEIFRFESNGTPDASWHSDGKLTTPVTAPYYNKAIVEDSNGKIVVGGNVTNFGEDPYIKVYRFNADGSDDNTFANGANADQHSHPGKMNDMIAGENGTVFFTGVSVKENEDQFLIAGFNNDATEYQGFADNNFLPQDTDIESGNLNKIIRLADGKLLVCGQIGLTDNSTRGIVMKLNSDGSPEGSFANDGLYMTNHIEQGFIDDMARQADGKILAVGRNGQDHVSSIAQYLPDGSFDMDFGFRGGIQGNNEVPKSIAPLSDGKFLVLGDINSNVGKSAYVARYQADGTLDKSFRTKGWDTYKTSCSTCTQIVNDGTVDTEGRIVLVGSTENQSIAYDYPNVIRLLADGTPDDAFGSSGYYAVKEGLSTITQFSHVALYADATMAGGFFRRINGAGNGNENVIQLLKLNSNGQPDPGFGQNGLFEYYPNDNTEAEVVALDLFPDGKILVAISYRLESGRYNQLLKLTANGQLDESFPGKGIFEITASKSGEPHEQAWIRTLKIDNEGNFVIIGSEYLINEFENLERQDFAAKFSEDGIVLKRNIYPNQSLGTGSFLFEENDRLIVGGAESNINEFTLRCLDLNALPYGGGAVTALEETAFPDNEKVLIFPNPADGQYAITIRLNQQFDVPTKVQLTDLFGKPTWNGLVQTGNVELQIPQEHIGPGLYLVKVWNDQIDYCKRVVKL